MPYFAMELTPDLEESPPLKFGFTMEDISCQTFQEQFNTYHVPIQTPAAFQQEVLEILDNSVNPDEFMSLLSKQKARKLEMLQRRLIGIGSYCTGKPSVFHQDGSGRKWASAIRLWRNKSYTAMVEFFDTMLPAANAPPDPYPPGAWKYVDEYHKDFPPGNPEPTDQDNRPEARAKSRNIKRKQNKRSAQEPRRSQRLSTKPAKRYKVTKPRTTSRWSTPELPPARALAKLDIAQLKQTSYGNGRYEPVQLVNCERLPAVLIHSSDAQTLLPETLAQSEHMLL